MAKLSPGQIEEIKTLFSSGKITKVKLGKMYSVSGSTIANVINHGYKYINYSKGETKCQD